jgi:hypothetical protein
VIQAEQRDFLRLAGFLVLGLHPFPEDEAFEAEDAVRGLNISNHL